MKDDRYSEPSFSAEHVTKSMISIWLPINKTFRNNLYNCYKAVKFVCLLISEITRSNCFFLYWIYRGGYIDYFFPLN